MKLVKLGDYHINPDRVAWVHHYSETTRVWFSGIEDDYVPLSMPIEEVVTALAQGNATPPHVDPSAMVDTRCDICDEVHPAGPCAAEQGRIARNLAEDIDLGIVEPSAAESDRVLELEISAALNCLDETIRRYAVLAIVARYRHPATEARMLELARSVVEDGGPEDDTLDAALVIETFGGGK